MFRLFVIFIFALNLHANEFNEEIFLLPQDSEKIENKITQLIENSQKNINIAMYNFSYKKFTKSLIKASKNGVKIHVILDKKNNENNENIKELLKNNINIKFINKKMHLKVAMFDDKYLLFGSANWTKKSFNQNHEILMLNQNKASIDKIKKHILSIE